MTAGTPVDCIAGPTYIYETVDTLYLYCDVTMEKRYTLLFGL